MVTLPVRHVGVERGADGAVRKQVRSCATLGWPSSMVSALAVQVDESHARVGDRDIAVDRHVGQRQRGIRRERNRIRAPCGRTRARRYGCPEDVGADREAACRARVIGDLHRLDAALFGRRTADDVASRWSPMPP